MSKPEFITFTGVDINSNLDRMVMLSSRYPIEWGVLFSPDRQGKPAHRRYPPHSFVELILDADLSLSLIHI